MELLTEETIRKAIKPFKEEIERDLDWWYGSETSYLNAFFGWDCHVLKEEDEETRVIVYDLDKDSTGFLTTNNVILNFKY